MLRPIISVCLPANSSMAGDSNYRVCGKHFQSRGNGINYSNGFTSTRSTNTRPTFSLGVANGNRSVQEQSKSVDVPMETKIYIVYYSMYGHVEKLAREIKKGADTVEGVEAKLFQVAETLPDEVLGKMYAPPKSADVPVITARELVEADGLVFGMPTRFGMMPTQMKALLDSTGQLWVTGALVGKPVGMFTSTSSQGSGHETTALTAVTQFAHHGMIIVPVGYTFGEGMYVMDEVKGGSAYGAGTFSGRDGSRQPSELELAHAFHQGKYLAGIFKKFKGGSA